MTQAPIIQQETKNEEAEEEEEEKKANMKKNETRYQTLRTLRAPSIASQLVRPDADNAHKRRFPTMARASRLHLIAVSSREGRLTKSVDEVHVERTRVLVGCPCY